MRILILAVLLLLPFSAQAEECEGFRIAMSQLEHEMGIKPGDTKAATPKAPALVDDAQTKQERIPYSQQRNVPVQENPSATAPNAPPQR